MSAYAVSALPAFIDPAIVLSTFMLSFIFVIVCARCKWKRIYVGDPVIQREGMESSYPKGRDGIPLTATRHVMFVFIMHDISLRRKGFGPI